MSIRIETEYPVAIDSPDHIAPHGTKNDNHTCTLLLQELDEYFKKRYSLMDLGCAGGQFIIDANKVFGQTAIGLEGSDYRLKNGCSNWAKYHNKYLFNCDISRPFRIYQDEEPMLFDCITSWEFLEHIAEDRMETVLLNVATHLKEDGIFIGQYATTPDVPGSTQACSLAGVPYMELHQTIRNPPWWDEQFARFFVSLGEYPFYGGVRDEGESIRYFLRKK